jgi:CheY-like chemotaxis protein
MDVDGRIAVVLDDNEDDRAQVAAIFPVNDLDRCVEFDDEEEFLAELRKEEASPAILFLDLRMSKQDSGLEVLKELRGLEKFQSLPVVMISGGDNASEIEACYREGANVYIHKSDEPREFATALERLLQIWTTTGRLPG